MPKLVAGDGRQLVVEGDAVSVGRRGAGDAQPTDFVDLSSFEGDKKTVSHRHVRVYRQGAVWYLLVEMNARNDTRVGGRLLRPGEVTPLHDHDLIQLGQVFLTFEADVDREATLVELAHAAAEFRLEERHFPLSASNGQWFSVGRRSPGEERRVDIDFTEVPGGISVSRSQAQVYRAADNWVWHEGDATNPTVIDGRTLTANEEVALTDGAALHVGRLRLTFHERRPARPVPSTILLLDLDRQEVDIKAGLTESVAIKIVNATGRTEQIRVEVSGIPSDWYEILRPDGTRGPDWLDQLNPARDVTDPAPELIKRATLYFKPPRAVSTEAGLYPVTVSATTQGDDPVVHAELLKLRVLVYAGLSVTVSPAETTGSRRKFAVELNNDSNADANVDLVVTEHEGLVCTPEPPRLKLANGATRKTVVKARVRRRHWWGPKRTYGFHLEAVSGEQRSIGRASMVCSPIVPEFLQGILSKLFSMLTPIAIPAISLAVAAVVLIGVGYFLLRPPDIKEFAAKPSALSPDPPTSTTTARLHWQVERATNLSIEPAVGSKPEGGTGDVDVTPDATTEYTLTAKNFIGISSTAKVTVSVLKVVAFRATPDHLSRENQEVALHWETVGALAVKVEPSDQIKDAKTSDDKTVHPAGPTVYTLTATGPGGSQARRDVAVGIDPPTIRNFDMTPAAGARIFPGNSVNLTWIADGATKATITASKGEVVPGKKELDVSAGPPAVVRPVSAGDVEYTLTVTNAAGSAQTTTKVSVAPVAITQFLANPPVVETGKSSTLHWEIEGANETTSISIDPEVGRVLKATDDHPVNPTGEKTVYVLTVQSADGAKQSRSVEVTVKPPEPKVDVFTASRPSVTRGEQIVLTWDVQNADQVEIRTGDNLLIVHTNTLKGAQADLPVTDTTYLLEATGKSGKANKEVQVKVQQPGAPTPAPTPDPKPAVAGPSPSPTRP